MTGTHQPCPTAQELADFANGRVPSQRLSELAEHLENCQACVNQLAQGSPDDRLVERLEKIEYVEGQKGPRTSGDPFELDENFRYKLIAELGEGGMGQVFKARHRVMKRTVALKTIRPELINHPEAVKRFAQEASAAARLSHPNIVTAFDAEQCGDLHMLVMEFVDGESISLMVNRWGPLPVEKAIDYTCQAADGLQHAHDRKMIHRDIKPQNLMLTEEGVVKILDFGLSKFRRDLESGETDSVSDETLLTLRNISLGTEGFIAPEQAADASSVDIRSDIYSLGCTLF
ncbi:MAG: serine/threonine-protein kinase, partial [Pirellulaceae bacterium]|nr:serine/threonine-protein kinase [Pirellulaceae bacterium]